MEKITQKSILVYVCLTVVLFAFSFSSFAQDKAKLYTEIAGDYEFDLDGQVIIITFLVEDGALFGTQENDPDPPTPLVPVEGKELEFEATNNNGEFFEISFSKGEDGKINKCLLITQGMELEGIKLVK
jgi:hypothetical protein